jgi:hypothetical protein
VLYRRDGRFADARARAAEGARVVAVVVDGMGRRLGQMRERIPADEARDARRRSHRGPAEPWS